MDIILSKTSNLYKEDTIQSNSINRSNDYKHLFIDFKVDYVANVSHSINSLNACSPVGLGENGAKSEFLKNINIKTIYPIGKDINAGENINNLFLIRNKQFKLVSLSEYLNEMSLFRIESLDLEFTSMPFMLPGHDSLQVAVDIELNNGEKYNGKSVFTYIWN